MEFPTSVTVSRFQPVPGWTRQVDRDAQQRITAVTWSGGQIGDGEYLDFAFIARTPKEAGKLSFRAFQTYAGGETVEWINPEGAQERPAAIVTVAAGATGPGGGTGSIEGSAAVPSSAAGSESPAAPQAAAPSSTAPAAAGPSGGSDSGLVVAIGAASLALLALILAVAALARRSRPVGSA